MIESIITQEKELGKIQDPAMRQMAQIYVRASAVATLCLDPKNIFTLAGAKFPPIEGLLGEMFHFHMKRSLNFFLEDKEFSRLVEKVRGQGSDFLLEFYKSMLIPLRQSVGSCFATAFLIHMQKEDLLFLAKDIYQTFVRKKMSRIINGEEVNIPLCPKVGPLDSKGASLFSPLMKSYEYTVASLADIQIGFSKWNFHEALGLDHQASGGLGKVIYDLVQKKLDEANLKIQELNQDIDDVEHSLDIDDAAFRSSYSIDRMNQIKRSAKGKHVHLNRLYDDVDSHVTGAEHLSKLYKFFVEQYLVLFPHYFQEVYDPELVSEDSSGDDRPAGFRLVYKHGRSDPKVWSYIYTDEQYIQSLFDFITGTEQILISMKRDEGLEKEIESIISEMLLMIREPQFIEEQKNRIAALHAKHLKEVNNISPYAYIAGGNMKSLIKSYYGVDGEIPLETIKAEKAIDLCYGLIEFMKDIKNIDVDEFEKEPFKPILVSNEIHAFNLLPGQRQFKKAWMNSGNTYSYIRDTLMNERDPIVFADTNWNGSFLAFLPNSDKTDFDLVLTNGITFDKFDTWNFMFGSKNVWEVYL